ncbi:serpin family protein [Frankia sp. Cas3]|uniref:serpin family protein n=1 Tax=Frankia sp. Cas3 TaxID=3073926 RepID=UPI002AD37098|nr:serpin family protein [Frankia sp. Cas3]
MGLAAFFELGGLAGLSPAPLVVTGVVQQALIRVAEEGIEAAAVTAIGIAGSARRPPPPLELTFNRPFAATVLDASGTVPLILCWQATAPTGQQLTLPD